jgi:hypothetical protein
MFYQPLREKLRERFRCPQGGGGELTNNMQGSLACVAHLPSPILEAFGTCSQHSVWA